MIALLTSLSQMATGQIGTPLGIIGLCVIFTLGLFHALPRGGVIIGVFMVALYFSSPWIVQELQSFTGVG